MSKEITAEIDSTFLSRTTAAVRDIFSKNTFIKSVLTDSLKGSDPIIGNKPLNWQQIANPYALSVYHTTREIPVSSNGVTTWKGLVYIDCFKKVNSYDEIIIMDEIDKFVWTCMAILLNADPSFDDNVEKWEFYDKELWKPTPTSSIGNEKAPEEKLNNYICQLTLLCNYNSNYGPF